MWAAYVWCVAAARTAKGGLAAVLAASVEELAWVGTAEPGAAATVAEAAVTNGGAMEVDGAGDAAAPPLIKTALVALLGLYDTKTPTPSSVRAGAPAPRRLSL